MERERESFQRFVQAACTCSVRIKEDRECVCVRERERRERSCISAQLLIEATHRASNMAEAEEAKGSGAEEETVNNEGDQEDINKQEEEEEEDELSKIFNNYESDVKVSVVGYLYTESS